MDNIPLNLYWSEEIVWLQRKISNGHKIETGKLISTDKIDKYLVKEFGFKQSFDGERIW